MNNPFKTDWANVDLVREGDLEIVSSLTFDALVTELESVQDLDREIALQHFTNRLRDITKEARTIFSDNVNNIVAYVNRHAIAEAVEANDQEVMEQIKLDFYSNNRSWRPISQEKFDYMLECLPPIRMGRGGFANSEPVDSLPNGEEVYFVGLKGNGVCHATYGTLAEWDSKALDLMYDIPNW